MAAALVLGAACSGTATSGADADAVVDGIGDGDVAADVQVEVLAGEDGEVEAADSEPPFVELCAPCTTDSDCNPTKGGLHRCRPLPSGAGFCTRDCTADLYCPPDYICSNARGCMPKEGFCRCSTWAINSGLKGYCGAIAGFCGVTATCETVGEPFTCMPAPVTAETCNGIDDDCNGMTDDGPAQDVCGDTNPCTSDHCSFGKCTHVSTFATCDDGEFCTNATCASDGTCKPTTLISNCNPDSCSAVGWCDFTVGCVSKPKVCDDGNPCTVDACDKGVCVFSPGSGACDDGDPCTENDACGTLGCAGVIINCSDGAACTSDWCVTGSGCAHLVECDDGNACTTDTCGKDGSCAHVPHTGSCVDDNLCTISESCVSGLCVGVTPTNCDDGNNCTSDSCNPWTGCAHLNLPTSSDCASGCIVAGTCALGGCAIPASKLLPSLTSVADILGTTGGGYLIAGSIDGITDTFGWWKGGKWLWNIPTPTGFFRRIATTQSGPVLAMTGTMGGAQTTVMWLDWNGETVDKNSKPLVVAQMSMQLLGMDAIAVSSTASGLPLIVRIPPTGTPWYVTGADPGRWNGVTTLGADIFVAGEVGGHAQTARVDAAGNLLWTKALPFGPVKAVAKLPTGAVLAVQAAAGQPTALLTISPAGEVQSIGPLALDAAPKFLLPRENGLLAVSGSTNVAQLQLDGRVDWLRNHGPAGSTPLLLATDGTTLLLHAEYQFTLHQQDVWDNDLCGDNPTCLASSATSCDDGNGSTSDLCDDAHGGCWHKPAVTADTCKPLSPCTTATWKDGVCTQTIAPDATKCDPGCGTTGICVGTVCQAAEPLGQHVIASANFGKTLVLDLRENELWMATSSTSQKPQPTVFRVDGTGVLLWQQEYPIAGGATTNTLLAVENGVLLGATRFDDSRPTLLRVDANGTALWQKSYEIPPSTTTSLAQMVENDKGFLLVGQFGASTYSRGLVLQVDKSGGELWRTEYSNPYSLLRAAATDKNGTWLGGATHIDQQHPQVPWLVKVDHNGTQLTEITLPLETTATSGQIDVLTVSEAGDVYAAGRRSARVPFVAKVDAAGKLGWMREVQPRQSGFVDAVPKNLTVEPDGSVSLGVAKNGIQGTNLRYAANGHLDEQVETTAKAPSFDIVAMTRSATRWVTATTQSDGIHLDLRDGWWNASCAKSGPCLDLPASACVDGDPCTHDRCDGDHGGCWHEELGTTGACDDDNACTSDSCKDGTCIHTAIADGSACGNECPRVCTNGICTAEVGTATIASTASAVLQAVGRTENGIVFSQVTAGFVSIVRADNAGKEVGRVQLKAAYDYVVNIFALPDTDSILLRLTSSGFVSSGPSTFLADSRGNLTVVPYMGSFVTLLGLGKGVCTLDSYGNLTAWSSDLVEKWKVNIGSGFNVMALPSGGAYLLKSPLALQKFDKDGINTDYQPISSFASQTGVFAFASGNDILVTGTCANSIWPCAVRLHDGNVLWTKLLPGFGSLDALTSRGDGTAFVQSGKVAGVINTDGEVLWTAGTDGPTSHFDTPASTIWKDASGSLHFSDTWLNPTCVASGPCLGRTASDCSDGNACTYDRCDASHGGCFHPSVPDGSPCGISGNCVKGVCFGG